MILDLIENLGRILRIIITCSVKLFFEHLGAIIALTVIGGLVAAAAFSAYENHVGEKPADATDYALIQQQPGTCANYTLQRRIKLWKADQSMFVLRKKHVYDVIADCEEYEKNSHIQRQQRMFEGK